MVTLLLGVGCIVVVLLLKCILEESTNMKAWEHQRIQMQLDQIERLRKETEELQTALRGVYRSPVFPVDYPKTLKEDMALRKEQDEEKEYLCPEKIYKSRNY